MTEKKTRWILILSLIITVMLTGFACNQNDDGSDNGVDNHDNEEVSTYEAQLYFVNSEYAITGDENLEHFLLETRELTVPENENPWLQILDELKIVDNDDAETAITKETIFGDIYVSSEDDSIMIVDLNSHNTGGSTMEGFFIRQIVRTIVNNAILFEESANVDKVQFLLNGEKIESLMGHFDASEPFYGSD
ncbi:MAG TPA: GerMN domain-containing protein [Anaerovoracaceae bacterium]|nr:GerMN domain-containing protein [Anaerovoracaceae bacterium]